MVTLNHGTEYLQRRRHRCWLFWRKWIIGACGIRRVSAAVAAITVIAEIDYVAAAPLILVNAIIVVVSFVGGARIVNITVAIGSSVADLA